MEAKYKVGDFLEAQVIGEITESRQNVFNDMLVYTLRVTHPNGKDYYVKDIPERYLFELPQPKGGIGEFVPLAKKAYLEAIKEKDENETK